MCALTVIAVILSNFSSLNAPTGVGSACQQKRSFCAWRVLGRRLLRARRGLNRVGPSQPLPTTIGVFRDETVSVFYSDIGNQCGCP
jgi:hypothetical protein